MTNLYSPIWFELFLETIQPAPTESETAFIARHLPNPPYETVLDLCCGQGRHTRLLADRGYRITGVDLNSAALDRARSQSSGPATYREMDMRHVMELPGSFDAVINLWQSFGYFDEVTNAGILEQVSRKLNPNGRLVLDIYHRGFFEQHQGVHHFERRGLTIVETKRMTAKRLTVQLDYGSGRVADAFDWRLYTPAEMCDHARQFGLVPLVICTGFDEEKPAAADSPRMQFVFEKQ